MDFSLQWLRGYPHTQPFVQLSTLQMATVHKTKINKRLFQRKNTRENTPACLLPSLPALVSIAVYTEEMGKHTQKTSWDR